VFWSCRQERRPGWGLVVGTAAISPIGRSQLTLLGNSSTTSDQRKTALRGRSEAGSL